MKILEYWEILNWINYRRHFSFIEIVNQCILVMQLKYYCLMYDKNIFKCTGSQKRRFCERLSGRWTAHFNESISTSCYADVRACAAPQLVRTRNLVIFFSFQTECHSFPHVFYQQWEETSLLVIDLACRGSQVVKVFYFITVTGLLRSTQPSSTQVLSRFIINNAITDHVTKKKCSSTSSQQSSLQTFIQLLYIIYHVMLLLIFVFTADWSLTCHTTHCSIPLRNVLVWCIQLKLWRM